MLNRIKWIQLRNCKSWIEIGLVQFSRIELYNERLQLDSWISQI